MAIENLCMLFTYLGAVLVMFEDQEKISGGLLY